MKTHFDKSLTDHTAENRVWILGLTFAGIVMVIGLVIVPFLEEYQEEQPKTNQPHLPQSNTPTPEPTITITKSPTQAPQLPTHSLVLPPKPEPESFILPKTPQPPVAPAPKPTTTPETTETTLSFLEFNDPAPETRTPESPTISEDLSLSAVLNETPVPPIQPEIETAPPLLTEIPLTPEAPSAQENSNVTGPPTTLEPDTLLEDLLKEETTTPPTPTPTVPAIPAPLAEIPIPEPSLQKPQIINPNPEPPVVPTPPSPLVRTSPPPETTPAAPTSPVIQPLTIANETEPKSNLSKSLLQPLPQRDDSFFNNSLVERFRSRNPNDSATNKELTEAMGDHYKVEGTFIQYAEKFPDWVSKYNIIKKEKRENEVLKALGLDE